MSQSLGARETKNLYRPLGRRARPAIKAMKKWQLPREIRHKILCDMRDSYLEWLIAHYPRLWQIRPLHGGRYELCPIGRYVNQAMIWLPTPYRCTELLVTTKFVEEVMQYRREVAEAEAEDHFFLSFIDWTDKCLFM